MFLSSVRAAAAIAAAMAFVCLAPAAARADLRPAGPEELDGMTAPGDVELPRHVYEAAGAYRAYMRQASGISPAFADGAAVAESLRTGASYEVGQLARGAVAYAAVVALQNEDFVRSVRAEARGYSGRKALAAEILADPIVAASFYGADAAAGQIVASVSDQGARLRAVGDDVRQAAYSVQSEKWSFAEVEGRDRRLAEAKALSSRPMFVSAGEVARLRDAAEGQGALRLRAPEAPMYSPVVQRGLALAALAVLGEADEGAVDEVMLEPECAQCLKMAKLNLFQCLAVSKPVYEDVFCLGQHGLKDTGDCIAETSSTSWKPTAARRRYSLAPRPAAAPAPPRSWEAAYDAWRDSGRW
ncbi:MAG TPA: hypothetical protein VF699_10155 [Caulobacteraceae bacterium]|jgi:hypothetical protein